MVQITTDVWMHHMRKGQFEEAWKYNDEVLKCRAGIPCWHLPRHLQYVWDGTPLNGKKVLVRCYHGLGDTIQFIRYVPLIKAIAREVIVWAQPKLIPLLKTTGIEELLPMHDGTPEADYDVDVELMELPHIFRTALATIPATIPYLHVTPKSSLSRNKKAAIGLVWKAGDWDERRSFPFSLFYPLNKITDVQFYILQPGAIAAGWQKEFGIFPGELNLLEYAQFVAGLNLLISIDSMPVHVAGALGTPVWALLQAGADWRWMEGRQDSPWYPTMRLFRQEKPGDWEQVTRRVAVELQAFVNNL